MKCEYFLSWILILLALTGFSQSADSLKVQALLDEASELLNNANNDESIARYEEAKRLAENFNMLHKVHEAENMIIQNMWRQYRLEEALLRANTLLPIIKKELGEGDLEVANTYHQLGVIEMLGGSNEVALSYYNKSIEIRNNYGEKGLSGISSAYVNMIYIYQQLGDVNKQLIYANKAYEIDLRIYGETHLYIAEDLSNIGALCITRSLFGTAIDYLKKALDVLVKLNEKGIAYSNVLSNLGNAYAESEEYEKAYQFQLQALRNNVKIYGESHVANAFIYEILGRDFRKQSLYDSSLSYYSKALEFETQLEKTDRASLIYIHQGVAFSYLGLDDEEKALVHINKALKLAEEISEINEFQFMLSHDLGVIHKRLENYDIAESLFLRSIEMINSNHISMKAWLIKAYQDLAELHDLKQNYTKSLSYYQKSIEANHNSWISQSLYDNPQVYGIQSKLDFLISLREKVSVLNKMYDVKKEVEIVLSLVDSYELIDELIGALRKSYSRRQDKIDFQNAYHSIYEGAIRTNLLAYELLGDEKYLKKSFNYSEADKSVLLAEVLDTSDWSDVPDELLHLEKEIKSDLSYYTSLLNAERNKKQNVDTTKVILFEHKLFNLNNSLDSVFMVLNTNYSVYYQVKYDHQSLDVRGVQDHLDGETAFLEYFFGDSSSFVFLITENAFLVKDLGPSSKILVSVNSFGDEVRNYSKATNANWVKSSEELYRQLIDPIKDGLYEINKLVIVPSGPLNYIPFDLLLDDNSANVSDFKSLPYLMKKYNIQNTYSAAIEFLRTKNDNRGRRTVLGFAPSYAQGMESSRDTQEWGRFRNALAPLEWNDKEIDHISELVSTSSFSGTQATERNFKLNANNHGIIHLAMHAFVDDNEPMNSRLVFTQASDSVEDGSLHTFELFNMKLNADLAVLSACETGYGRLIRGEGIMSLSRGFAYAGVPSIVMSHWQVDDQSTSKLMELFYKNLSDGLSKSKALRMAKLDFLANAGPNKEHPFFWGSFVVIGDDSPVFKNNQVLYYYLGGLLLLLIVAGVYYRKKTKSVKN